MSRNLKITVFHSFEAENKADYRRRALMTHKERCQEFETLQERMWGDKWYLEPIIKKATWETVAW